MEESFCALGQGSLPLIFARNIAFNDTSVVVTIIAVAIYVVLVFRKRHSKISYGFEVPALWKETLKIIGVIVIICVIGYVMIVYKGIPYAILLLVIMALVFTMIAQNTAFGRHVYAIGGNKDAAKLSGINVERATMGIFIQMGLIAAIASIVYLGRVRQATPQAGTNFEFSAITGCIVGGASTLGGVGTIVGAIIGTILVASIDNGMSLLNLPSEFQYIVKGLVLLIAVTCDILTKKGKS
jgi:D-xylose transport system permease protein